MAPVVPCGQVVTGEVRWNDVVASRLTCLAGMARSLRSTKLPSSLAAKRGSDEGRGARIDAVPRPIFRVTRE